MIFQLVFVTALVANAFGDLCPEGWMHNGDENVCVKVFESTWKNFGDAMEYYESIPDMLQLSDNKEDIKFVVYFKTGVEEVVEDEVETDVLIEENPAEPGTLHDPEVPFMTSILPGKIIYISGIPKTNFGRFSVNFLNGPDNSHDFLMHLDMRYNYGAFQKVAVTDNRINGSWRNSKVLSGPFPFSPDTPFEMTLEIEQDLVKVDVNGEHFLDFKMASKDTDTLYISGDVIINEIRFQEKK